MNLNNIKVTRYEFDGIGIFHAIDLLESCQMGKRYKSFRRNSKEI